MSDIVPISIVKDPSAILDYTFDWSAWVPSGDTLLTATIVLDPLTNLVVDSVTNGLTTATVWLSGGTAGSRYKVINRVTTVQGRQDERTITVSVKNR